MLDEDKIEKETIKYFQNIAGRREDKPQMSSRWRNQYAPKHDINENVYNDLILLILEDEWEATIKKLPNDKAPGLSKISNELLKHMSEKMKELTRKLVNLCLEIGDIPEEWRHALIYPIPKTMDWENLLSKTRPIVLIETLRKTFVKIITSRLTNIIHKNNILKGGNHAAMPEGSTETPLRIINSCIEDAKEKNREIWLTFQDLSKAYDRVDLDMLKKAMNRIKMPPIIIKLILHLFKSSKKAIIGHNCIFEKFISIIGIDQGETISPLLWTIYYDPFSPKSTILNMDINWNMNGKTMS